MNAGVNLFGDEIIKKELNENLKTNAFQMYLIVRGFLAERCIGFEDELDQVLPYLVELYTLATVGEKAEQN